VLPDDKTSLEQIGKYKLLGKIGQGAMGVVYKAVDPIIDRTVAIKTINLNLSKTELEEYEQRFQQEIKAAGRLNHPNIVTIYDVGKTDQVAYMAMEFLEGQELKDMITFYKTPLGQKMIEQEPKAGEASTKRAQIWIDKYAETVIAKMRAEMRKRGHNEF